LAATPRRSCPPFASPGGLLLVAALLLGCGSDGPASAPEPVPSEPPATVETPPVQPLSEQATTDLVAAETWIREMTPVLRGVVQLGLLAGDRAEGTPEVLSSATLPSTGIRTTKLSGGLGDLLVSFAHVKKVKLKFFDARPGEDGEDGEYESVVFAYAYGEPSVGRVGSVFAKVNATWKGDDVTAWTTTELSMVEGASKLFEEVRGPDALEALRGNLHDDKIVAFFKDEAFVPPPYFEVAAFDRHPGISVVDIDRDGWDDLYVMHRWGTNRLLRNKGDGTFEDVAADYGLDLTDHCSSALFADFDNDGDTDVFVGRTLLRSVYLERDGDRYTAKDVGELPMLVSALASADIDGDGLLDVYVASYATSLIQTELMSHDEVEREVGMLGRAGGPSLAAFLDAPSATRLGALLSRDDAHPFLNMPGPPNVLLRNVGGTSFVAGVEQADHNWRNTYAVGFSDYDGDGDQDLFVANDFAPNVLLRNDGSGALTDVTAEVGATEMGLGMGVAWADYDDDGVQDLYVSNMYSKAGTRILGKLPGVDPRMLAAASGNTLFRGTGTGFELVSGEGEGQQPVRIVGWSWGGQFGDLDNNGRLDLFVPSGYYSAPSEVASEADC